MKKPKKQGPEPGRRRQAERQGANRSRCCPPRPGDAELAGNDKLIEQVRQIVDETPEVRPEKVEPLQEAVEQGTYEIDARKLANILITELILGYPRSPAHFSP